MALSYQDVTSDGTLALLVLTIEYRKRTEIVVSFDGVEQVEGDTWDWQAPTGNTIVFSPNVPNGVLVRVNRETELTTPVHKFGLGSAFTGPNIDENFTQALRIAQEAREGLRFQDAQNNLNMAEFKITNVGAPTLPGDAVNLQTMTDTVAASVTDGSGNPVLVKLAGTAGATLVGADDESGGTLFSTVGGFIAKVLSSTGAAIVGFIHAGVGAVKRAVQDKLRDHINVLDYGVVGAGGDDTAVFLNACVACAAQKKVLNVPAGTFRLSGKLVVPHGMICAGSNATFFQGINNGTKSGNLLELGGPGTYRGFTVDGAVSADPGTWTAGNYNAFTGWNNVYLMSNDIVCEDIFSRNSAQAGFGAWGLSRCKFTNCRTLRTRNNFGDGFFAYLCTDFEYVNCYSEDYTRIGFVWDGDGVTSVADRVKYTNCHAKLGRESSILHGGGEYNSGFWAENHDNASYDNCTADDNTYSGFTVAAANGGARRTSLRNCNSRKTPTGYVASTFSATERLSLTLDACHFDADGVVVVDGYAIGDMTSAVLTDCSAKLSGGGSQTRVIGLGHAARVEVNQFSEYWSSKPIANLYDIGLSVASIGGFPGGGSIPDGFTVLGYKTINPAEPCVVKWIGSALSGCVVLTGGVYDIPLLNTNGTVELSNSTMNAGGTASIITGSMTRVVLRDSSIANRVTIGWNDSLDQVVVDSCNLTRTVSGPNIFFYRNAGTLYKPARLKLLNSTFSSDLAAFNYYIQQNAEPAVFNNAGQNIVGTGVVFHNTGGATANFAIRQEAASGAASTAYISGGWKSSTISNVATYLQAGSVVNNL